MEAEFDIRDARKEMNPMDVYAVVTCSIEDKELYERALKHEDSCGLFSVYRHRKTSATITVQSESSGGADDLAYLSILGEDSQIIETLNEIQSIIPKRFVLEKIVGGHK